jgi:hypothetical protein
MPAHPVSRLVRFTLAVGTSVILDHLGYGRPTPVRMVEAVELVACHVFSLADRDDQRVSMELVRTRLERLAEHPPGHCQFCVAAAKVSAVDLYRNRLGLAASDHHHQDTRTALIGDRAISVGDRDRHPCHLHRARPDLDS